MFPEVAFALECEAVRSHLINQLSLQAEVVSLHSEASAFLTLNDGYLLVLRPAAQGFNGVNNWFKWRELTNSNTGQVLRMSQVRCAIELCLEQSDTGEQVSVISFGLDAANLEQLILDAIEKIQRLCNLRLLPLPIVKTNNQ
jgi:hypothetical protein